VIENAGHVVPNPRASFYTKASPSAHSSPDAGRSFSLVGDASAARIVGGDDDSNKVITASFSKRPSLQVGTPLEGLFEDGFRLTLAGEFGGSI